MFSLKCIIPVAWNTTFAAIVWFPSALEIFSIIDLVSLFNSLWGKNTWSFVSLGCNLFLGFPTLVVRKNQNHHIAQKKEYLRFFCIVLWVIVRRQIFLPINPRVFLASLWNVFWQKDVYVQKLIFPLYCIHLLQDNLFAVKPPTPCLIA